MSGGPNKKNGSDRHGIGGNLGPPFVADPGPADDFTDTGPVAWSRNVDPADRERFYAAIRSQGPELVEVAGKDGSKPVHVRRRAIDMATERARRDKGLSGTAFRFFHAVASRSKWKHRYYWQSTEMLAFISAQNPKHSNAARYVDDAVELGYLVDIYVPSGVGGRHKRYLTVACTATDRTGQTLDDIASEARQHKVRGAEENQDETTANDDRTSNPQPRDVNGTAIRNSDALPCNSGEAIRNPDVSIRNPDVSIRNPDALTLDTHCTDARGEGRGARPHHASQSVHSPPQHESTPLSPPPAEYDLQLNGQGTGVHGIDGAGLGEGVYAIHRSWWPGLTCAEADSMLDDHLKALVGSNPGHQLERIILALKVEHAAGKAREPGKLVERRIEKANARTRAGKYRADAAVETAFFKPWDVLGSVGFGVKVTGADAMDILAAVPGSDPDTVRRLIRDVSGKWAGPNGKSKSAQHVVDEVIVRLRAPDLSGQAETPRETIVLSNPSNSKEDGARYAALRKRLPLSDPKCPETESGQPTSSRPPTRA